MSAQDLPPAPDTGGPRAAAPGPFAEVVAGLGWSVTDPDELLEYLQQTARLAVRTVSGADHAGVTVVVDGSPFTATSTDETTLDVDAHQYEAGDGPCLHAARTGQVVEVDVAHSRERWPDFTRHAEAIGVHSFLAAPLGASGSWLGALNLYSRSVDGFTDDDRALVQVLVGQATRTVLDYARLTAAERLADQLREAMSSRAPIEQAKGMLMAAHRIDADAAFTVLRRRSQESNTKLSVVAERLVAGQLGGRPDSPGAR